MTVGFYFMYQNAIATIICGLCNFSTERNTFLGEER